MSAWGRILSGDIDRRWIYLMIFFVIAIPNLKPLGMPIPITKQTKEFSDIIEKVPEGSPVCFAITTSASYWSELGPVSLAISNHLFQNNLKVVYVTFGVEAPILIERTIKDAKKPANLEYGRDYVNLGYIAGGETGIGAFSKNPKLNPVDYRGKQVETLSIMKDINNLDDFSVVIYITSGAHDEYFRQWGDFDVPILVGAQSAGVQMLMPYYDSGAASAYIASLRGAAEYETLIGIPGKGLARMDSVQMIFLLGIILIIITNLGVISEKLGGGKT